MGSLSFQKVLYSAPTGHGFNKCTDCFHLGPRGKVELAPKDRLTNASSKEVLVHGLTLILYLTFL